MAALFLLDLTSVLVGGLVLLGLWLWRSTWRRPPGLPPGPGPALPLLGHLHLLDKDPRPQFLRWRRQYGDVFSLYLGGKLTVVLASCSAIKEALVSMGDVFTDRPHLFLFDQLLQRKGIVGSSGPLWKEQRKTGLEILRAMGMGKNVLAEKIQEEITHYIRAIQDHQGAPMDPRKLTQVSISNNVCSIIFGKRFDYQDSTFVQYLEHVDRNFKLLPSSGIVNILPAVRYIPGDLFKLKTLMSNAKAVEGFIKHHVAQHQKALAEEDNDHNAESTLGKGTAVTEQHKDFIFSYLHRVEKEKTKGNGATTLDVDNLQRSVSDLFVGGTETTFSAILWALIYLIHYPHVQEKCFQEISRVVGPTRPPSMKDKPSLTYVEATIREVLRKGDLSPLSAMHDTARDVAFRGYVIPKGCVIIPFLGSVLQDLGVWGDPENFRPERFIGPDGKLSRREELIPFGAGRRVCLGESLARMELFLYLTTLIQHFRFLPAPEEEGGGLPSLIGELGITHTPKPFKIRAVSRV